MKLNPLQTIQAKASFRKLRIILIFQNGRLNHEPSLIDSAHREFQPMHGLAYASIFGNPVQRRSLSTKCFRCFLNVAGIGRHGALDVIIPSRRNGINTGKRLR